MKNSMKPTIGLLVLGAVLTATTAAVADEAQSGSQLEEVIVTAQQARKQVVSDGNVGVLGMQDALSIPFNVTTFTSKLILDQQSETIGAVLQNDPAVRVTDGSGNQSELFVIRGFPLNGDDISIEGLFGIAPRQLVSPELYESVQVLTGASAFLYGAAPSGSGVGGGVDLSLKRASKNLLRLTGSYIADDIKGGALDVGQRFGDQGEFGARANAVYRTGGTAIDGERTTVDAESLDLDWGRGPYRVFLDLGYEDQQAHRSRPEVRLATGIAVPAPPNPTANYGQPWTYTSLRDLYSLVRTEINLVKDVQFYASAGLRHGHEEGDYSTLTVTNATTGAATGSRLYVPRRDKNYSVLTGLRGQFETGPVSHQINVGASYVSEENRNSYSFGSFASGVRASATTFFDNLYDTPLVPRPTNSTLPSSGGSLTNPPLVAKTSLKSAFFSDTLGAFDDRVQLLAGVRRQDIVVKGYNRGTGALTSNYGQWASTPVVGIVFKATGNLSIYGNRIEALVQGPTAPLSATVVNPGQVFAPFVSVQYETGAKLAYHALTSTLALYQIEEPSAYAAPVPGSSTLTRFGVYGQQRNRGIEFTLNGEPTDYLRFIGGFAINQARIRKSAGGTLDGKDAIGVPDFQGDIGLEFIPPMLEQAVLTARVHFTSDQYLDAGNTQQLSSWNRVDLGARYVLVAHDHPLTLRLSVENVANKGYWESAFGGYLVQGEPRTVKASITGEY